MDHEDHKPKDWEKKFAAASVKGGGADIGDPKDLGGAVVGKLEDFFDMLGDKLMDVGRAFVHSGFGKGVLVTAALILIGSAIGFGYGGSLGMITSVGVEPPIVATAGQGVMIGLGHALNVLADGWGIIAMAAGGTIGSIVKMHHDQQAGEPDKAEVAAKAKEKEAGRARELAPATPGYGMDTKPDDYWVGYDSERRARGDDSRYL